MLFGVLGARGVSVNPPVDLKLNIAAVIAVTLTPIAKEKVVQGSIVNLPAAKILAVSCKWQLLSTFNALIIRSGGWSLGGMELMGTMQCNLWFWI